MVAYRVLEKNFWKSSVVTGQAVKIMERILWNLRSWKTEESPNPFWIRKGIKLQLSWYFAKRCESLAVFSGSIEEIYLCCRFQYEKRLKFIKYLLGYVLTLTNRKFRLNPMMETSNRKEGSTFSRADVQIKLFLNVNQIFRFMCLLIPRRNSNFLKFRLWVLSLVCFLCTTKLKI